MFITSSKNKTKATINLLIKKAKLDDQQHKLVVDLIHLLPSVPNIHKDYDYKQIITWFVVPILQNQYFAVYQDGKLVAFLTYAFLDKKTENRWLTKKHQLTDADWKSGNIPWLIDCLAPFGHARKVSMMLVNHLRASGYRGVRLKFRRFYPNKESRYSSSLL